MQLPMNRIRQLCQRDHDEGTLISKQALVLITKATELFVQDLAGVCGQIAKMQKRRTLQVGDITQAASNIDKFHFISDSRLPSLNPRRHEDAATNKEIERIIEDELREEDRKKNAQ